MSRITEIKTTELAALRRKAQAHDDYLAAIRNVEKRHAQITSKPNFSEAFIRGYAACIDDLAQAVADAVGFRFAEAAMVCAAESPLVFDRGLPGLRFPRG